MSFFKQLSDTVTNLVKQATSPKSPLEVQEVSTSTFDKLTPIITEDSVRLYKDGTVYFCVVHCPRSSPKAYSLLRSMAESEAMTSFANVSYKLQPLYQSSGRVLHRETLQMFMDALRANPTWTSAHLAVKLGLIECIRNPLIFQNINTPDEMTQILPIHVAIDMGNIDIIQEMIITGVKLSMADSQGNNVYHCAAKGNSPKVIQFLASKDPSSLNQLNVYGESALHVACGCDRPGNVEQLLRWGAKPELTMSGRYPIHCAMKAGSARCAEVLCKWSREQIHVKDSKYGGSPAHWAKNRESVYMLADLGCNLDVVNNVGETALHIMIQRNRQPCVMGLLAKGASAEAVGRGGANALHMAIMTDNFDLVQMLIVFGADLNAVNEHGHSPRHLAATNVTRNKDVILFLLHAVGATRCVPGTPGCTVGCVAGGTHNGKQLGKGVPITPEHQKKVHEDIVSDIAMAAAMTRSESISSSSVMTGEMSAVGSKGAMGSSGDRILSLDGGGIRGLVLIQILLAIEKAAGQPIQSCFDWIGGTSTGGILALAIVHGKSVRHTQGLYFQLKDIVFQGKRPYPSEPLEGFLRKEFGEHTRMSEVQYPRVIVTGVLADRNPAELHLFRNYDPPGETYKEPENPLFPNPPRPNEQYVWRAGRSSGAAPTYFRTFGRFLDGGLISNNPTLDVMTEVHEYNMRLKATSRTSEVRPMHVVVSLGTGRPPVKKINPVDVYKPEGLFDIAKVVVNAKNLTEILIEQCTQSEGQTVQRAKAWCCMVGVPYYRYSPQLSEDVPLDCKDDKTLMNMLWETQCYIHRNHDKIKQLATLLRA